MGKPVTLPWSAARWRQNTYAPRVTKVHDPVSGMALHPVGLLAMQLRAGGGIDALTGDDVACQGCGYHVCNCKDYREACADGVFLPELNVIYNFPIVMELERGQRLIPRSGW